MWVKHEMQSLYEIPSFAMMKNLLFLWLTLPIIGFGQSYTSYFTGNTTDVVSNPGGGVCLMGGASEDNNAMQWFLERADGGDVLVLRASGSDGYNDYLYSELGVAVNSVETIKFNSAEASFEPYVLQKIQQAEAIWFAGGNQWNYVSFWRNSPVDSLINLALSERNIVIGGTSAGMAILGGYYFSAQNGTITSEEALADPYNDRMAVDGTPFLVNNYLQDVITDTHFDDPDRKGRLITFLAKIYTDYGVAARAIACDEFTAVCIDPEGTARVFGGHPTYDDNAYFLQVNCELSSPLPENCTEGSPLTWHHQGKAVKVYQVKGTSDGANTLDLNDWNSGTGGSWVDWSVEEGVFSENAGDPLDCAVHTAEKFLENDFQLFPSVANTSISIVSQNLKLDLKEVKVLNALGQEIQLKLIHQTQDSLQLEVIDLSPGVYYVQLFSKGKVISVLEFIKE